MAMEFQKGYKTVFANPGWFKKALLLSLYNFIPVIGSFAYMGAILDRVTMVRDGRETELPPRAGKFVDNLATGFFVMLPTLAAMLVVFFTFGVGVLLYIPFMVLYPALIANYLTGERSLGELFQFGEVWKRVKANSEAYLNYWLSSLIYGFVSSLVLVPVVVAAEVPLIMASANLTGSSSDAGAVLILILSFFIFFSLVMFVAYAVSTLVSQSSYYYLGLYARQAYPERGVPVFAANTLMPVPPLPPVATADFPAPPAPPAPPQ